MNRHSKSELTKLAFVALASLLCILALVPSAWPATDCSAQGKMMDREIDVKLETAYLFNPHLNNFTIDTDVVDGDVMLTGTVRSKVDKDLAGEIAKSVDGVESVDNSLRIEPDLETPKSSGGENAFLRKVTDATTTAIIKTKLIANDNLSASDIDVDTDNKSVRLSGQVNSSAERQLAEYIAKNTSGVVSVSNQLEVRKSSPGAGS